MEAAEVTGFHTDIKMWGKRPQQILARGDTDWWGCLNSYKDFLCYWDAVQGSRRYWFSVLVKHKSEETSWCFRASASSPEIDIQAPSKLASKFSWRFSVLFTFCFWLLIWVIFSFLFWTFLKIHRNFWSFLSQILLSTLTDFQAGWTLSFAEFH